MTSISKLRNILGWNDMNDSSEMSAGSSDEENFNNLQKREPNNESSSLQKIENIEDSTKEQNEKNTKIRDKTAEGLQKLMNHSEDNVWLYIFNNYEGNEDKITQILKDNNDFIEISTFAKGWNVLIKTEKAKKYIQESYFQNEYQIEFSFSTKNEKSGNKPKWNSKFKEDRFEDEPYSPKKGYNKNFNDKNNYQKDSYEEKGKKKVRYVAKESKESESPKFKQDHPTLTQKASNEDQRQNQKNKNKIKNKKSEERFVDPNNPFSVFA